MHVSRVTSLAASLPTPGREAHGATEAIDAEAFAATVATTDAAGALQSVVDGKGNETIQLAKRELSSVGCPTWEDCVHLPHEDKVTLFMFGADEGSDEKYMVRHVVKFLDAYPLVMCVGCFCFSTGLTTSLNQQSV